MQSKNGKLEEILEIISFVEKIHWQDIKEYWKVEFNIEDFQNIREIKIDYEEEALRIISVNIKNNLNTLKKAKGYIGFLVKNNKLESEIAKKVIKFEEVHSLFTSFEVFSILFSAEDYKYCIEYYHKNTAKLKENSDVKKKYRDSLSKIGNYVRMIDMKESNIEILLSDMRYLWQKGDFVQALQISEKIEKRELNSSQKAMLINDKIRILRDMGRIGETEELLKELECVVESGEFDTNKDQNKLRGKYIYNYAINSYIKGEFARSIALCEESLNFREDNYSISYLKLRIARCYILKGDEGKYTELMESIDFNSLDSWAKSLYMTVKSEYCRFIQDKTISSEKYLKESNKLEIKTGAEIIYTDIALLNLYIQLGKRDDIKRYLNTVRKYDQYIDGRLTVAVAELALNIIAGERCLDNDILRICDQFKEYPVFLFVGLFSLCKLLERYYLNIPDLSNKVSFGRDFSKEILSALSKKMRVQIIYSWIDEQGDTDDENKKWVRNLAVTLQRQGIICLLDIFYGQRDTNNIKEPILYNNCDKYIVVLTRGFKKRVEEKEGIIYLEYKAIMELCESDLNKIIFVLRDRNEFVSTEEIKDYTKCDLSDVKRCNRSERKMAMLIKRINDIPIYDATLPLMDKDFPQEIIDYEK